MNPNEQQTPNDQYAPQQESQPQQVDPNVQPTQTVPTQQVQPVAAPQPQVPTKIHAPGKSGSILALTEPGEEIVFRVKKHPFGLFVMYLQALLGYILVGGLLLFTVPSVVNAGGDGTEPTWLTTALGLMGIVLLLILMLVTWVYRQNELLLTNRNITQVIRNGLFDRQVSQLTLNNIEDVTAEKKGIWAMIFNYGQVRVETAGEQNNFHFRYCPSPDHYGQQILDARAACQPNTPPH